MSALKGDRAEVDAGGGEFPLREITLRTADVSDDDSTSPVSELSSLLTPRSTRARPNYDPDLDWEGPAAGRSSHHAAFQCATLATFLFAGAVFGADFAHMAYSRKEGARSRVPILSPEAPSSVDFVGTAPREKTSPNAKRMAKARKRMAKARKRTAEALKERAEAKEGGSKGHDNGADKGTATVATAPGETPRGTPGRTPPPPEPQGQRTGPDAANRADALPHFEVERRGRAGAGEVAPADRPRRGARPGRG